MKVSGQGQGLSRAQLTRLVRQFAKTGQVVEPPRRAAAAVERRYTRRHCSRGGRDARDGRAGHAEVMRRYSCRRRRPPLQPGKSTTYLLQRTVLDREWPSGRGGRRAPTAGPASFAVDTVHQGDLDGSGRLPDQRRRRGPQFEYVGAVAAISERFQGLLEGFHADNGSEYIPPGRRAARQAARRVSRARQALCRGQERQRKWFGHAHIPRRFAPLVDRFARDVLSPALNFHRPRMFPVEHADDDGRLRKRYPHDAVTTPYERLKSLDGAERFLKPDVSFGDLDKIAQAASDLAAMREVNRARDELFRAIGPAPDAAKVA